MAVARTVGALDPPLRRLFETIEPHADLHATDLEEIAAALTMLAHDHDYLVPAIERMGDVSASMPLHVPERGPRLFLVHRRTGEMSAVHDHRVWVAIAAITGVETHRRWRPRSAHDPARLSVEDEQAVVPTECVTLLPPDDIHDHGHRLGVGDAAYVLILLGDDQFRHERHEWDPASGRIRTLRPGDRGRWLASEPFPG